MKKTAKIVFLAVVSIFLLDGCATGRGRTGRFDRIPARQSSYRVHGTNEIGLLSTSQKQKLQARTRAWRWPTNEVVLTSKFGTRGGDHHDGVDLRASSGTTVRAAADGKVIYAGSKISGYGRMVVLRHSGRLSTIYAHNSRLFVREGVNVRRGQQIALSGNTGHSSGPHLHFEVREGVTAIDPLLLLPSPAVANEANRRMARYSQSSSRRIASSSSRTAARLADGDGFRPATPRRRTR